MQQLLEIFPFINQTKIDLEKQNKFLNKVTLTGKINALHVAANLFDFTDKTAIVFDELKLELIEALLHENIKKITNELSFKSKTAIDILIRNLFERTADIGFFSTDSLITEYLTSTHISDKQILKHLREYADKYSVYNEIVIFDTNGNVKLNMNQENIFSKTNDTIIQEALQSDSYIERYASTDIFKAQKKTLLYVQKITHKSQNIGVLCLCFKFEDELQTIFKNLSHNKEIISLSDSKEILESNGTQNYSPYSSQDYTIRKQNYIAVDAKTSGYQGYNGIDGWFTTAMDNTSNIQIPITPEENSEDDNNSNKNKYTSKSAKPNLLSDELNQIIKKANNIIEDIADVIINGEIIASKQKVYVLTPILDNLRSISSELLFSIKSSITNLEYVVQEGLINDVKMASYLAIDIMDRNLYERANDSRWWALTPAFKKELASNESNTTLLNEKLKYINNLYTVYTNIFIFDAHKKVVASSNDSSLIGKTLHEEYADKTLTNKNSQHYFVSKFENSDLYENRATYIYSASITMEGKVLGGIGVVFDAKPEFEAMLNDSFPENKKGFMLFIDEDKKVISSNNPKIKILSIFDIKDKFVNVKAEDSTYDFLTYNETNYLVASVLSKGYREYKTQDNYKNNIFALTFIEI